jgi:hypothetical protein
MAPRKKLFFIKDTVAHPTHGTTRYLAWFSEKDQTERPQVVIDIDHLDRVWNIRGDSRDCALLARTVRALRDK